MNEVLRGYADAAFESAAGSGRLAQVRSELEAFGAALVSYGELRGVLTDGSVPLATRQAIVAELLESRASEAVGALRFAVRVVPARELPTTAAELVVLADEAIESEGRPARDIGASSASRARLRGYAERVLEELSGPAELDEVEDELFRVARLIDDTGALRSVLSNTSQSALARASVLSELLEGRAQVATVRLATYTVLAGRVRDLAGTFDWLVELCAEERGRRVAEVRSAVALDDIEIERLASALSRVVGRPVEVRVVIDPAIVGGMLVSVGDLVVDGTIRSRFERLRDVFAH